MNLAFFGLSLSKAFTYCAFDGRRLTWPCEAVERGHRETGPFSPGGEGKANIVSELHGPLYAYLFQKNFVMRNDDQCTLIFVDGPCQNFNILNIQVIGWLV